MNTKRYMVVLFALAFAVMTVVPVFATPNRPQISGVNIQCVKWNLTHMAQAKGFAPSWYQRLERFISDLDVVSNQIPSLPGLVSRAIMIASKGGISVPWVIGAVTSCWR